MKVSSLLQSIELRDDKSVDTILGDLEVAADCSNIRIKSQRVEFPWDEQAERAVATYLKLPKAYLHRCDPEFRAHTVNHWFAHAANADTSVEYTARAEEGPALIALQSPDRPVLPLSAVGDIVTRIFHPDDDIVLLLRDESKFHLDVMTTHSVTVPPVESLPDRRVGDITRGGVRILATPHTSTPPVVQQYLHRLVCTNGMTEPRAEGTIKLRGRTLPEVLAELEAAAEKVLASLDDKLTAYATMATKRIPGNPATFAFRVAQESGIGPAATERIMTRAGALPTTGEVSLYDIANIFTEVAQSGITYKTQTRLQEVAGAMTVDQDAQLARCESCEKPLDDR